MGCLRSPFSGVGECQQHSICWFFSPPGLQCEPQGGGGAVRCARGSVCGECRVCQRGNRMRTQVCSPQFFRKESITAVEPKNAASVEKVQRQEGRVWYRLSRRGSMKVATPADRVSAFMAVHVGRYAVVPKAAVRLCSFTAEGSCWLLTGHSEPLAGWGWGVCGCGGGPTPRLVEGPARPFSPRCLERGQRWVGLGCSCPARPQ